LPQKGQEIFALYRGTLENGKQFDANQNRDSPFNFTLGQGAVIKGWDEGFATMRRGEKATLICGPDYAYGARGSPPSIPANATLHFEVELLDFKDKKKEKWEFSDEEKMAEATSLKASGNDKLKAGNYTGATADYKEGIDFLENETSGEAKQLLNILRLNSAQAYLKLNRNSDVIDNCSKVLKEEGDCLKALYRRGLAYSKLQDFEKATVSMQPLRETSRNFSSTTPPTGKP
jgi:peptidylprolyl isomerase